MIDTPDLRCSPDRAGVCQRYHRGHNLHWIHARRVGESPWGWRDAVVAAVHDEGLTLDYVLDEGRPRVWHHTTLTGLLGVGALVRLHEGYGVLGGPFGWLNVLVKDGIGGVPTPDAPELWRQETTVPVTDLSTGRALPMDHLRP